MFPLKGNTALAQVDKCTLYRCNLNIKQRGQRRHIGVWARWPGRIYRYNLQVQPTETVSQHNLQNPSTGKICLFNRKVQSAGTIRKYFFWYNLKVHYGGTICMYNRKIKSVSINTVTIYRFVCRYSVQIQFAGTVY